MGSCRPRPGRIAGRRCVTEKGGQGQVLDHAAVSAAIRPSLRVATGRRGRSRPGRLPANYRDGVIRGAYSKCSARLLEELLFLGGGSSGKDAISMWKAAEAGNDRVMLARRLNKRRPVVVFW